MMSSEEMSRFLEEYRDGVINEDDARKLAKIIRSGGDEAKWIVSELQFTGLLAQALESMDDESFARSFIERLAAERTSQQFTDEVIAKSTGAHPAVKPSEDETLSAGQIAGLATAGSDAKRDDRAARGRKKMLVFVLLLVVVAAAIIFSSGPAGAPVATLTEHVPGVALLRGGTESEISAKSSILAGDTLRVPTSGSASAQYADGSWVRLLDGAALAFAPDPLPSSMVNGDLAKTLVLHHGKLEAEFKPQANTRDVAIFTPHAIVEMSGGRISLTLTQSSTRLDVIAGEVDIVREDDGLSTRVEPGHYTIISKGADPVVLPRQ
ncbi:MAG: hypothetical protein ACI8W8_000730 [Rhodothermales bacterium]|jgi:hypothetical protein